MPFTRPTLEEIKTRIEADIDSRLPGSDAKLRRSNTNVLARVMAGVIHSLYGFISWLAEQVMPDTATVEYLERHAAIYGITRKSATAAKGNITFTGTSGTTIPAGTALQRSDGAEYTTDVDVTLANSTGTVAVTASIAGSAGDTVAASSLSLISPIAGVNATATVATGGLVDGTDTESDDDLRARVLLRIQLPPHGGTSFDYVQWALEVGSVTRAWCQPLVRGAGTVDVYFVCDDHETSIIPSAGLVNDVQDYIDERRPVTADVEVIAPTAQVLNFTISVTPNTAAVKSAVEAELTDMIQREAQVSDGAGYGTIYLSRINEAISQAAGETDHALVAPVADVEPDAGHIVIMGTITWQ